MFVSCDDDPARDAESPILGSITFEPSTSVAPDDSVTAVVSYEKTGKNIYKIDFSYSIVGKNPETGKDSTFLSGSWVDIAPTKHQPVFGFHAPLEEGNYRVTVKAARINYSTSGPNGELYGTPSSTTGTFSVSN